MVNKEDYRLKIILTASRIFSHYGFRKTTMEEISKALKKGKSSIYYYFGSKEEIFEAIIIDQHPYKKILPLILAVEGETGEEFFGNAFRIVINELGQQPEFINLMFIEMVEFKGQHVSQLFDIAFPQVMSFANRALQDRPELRPIPMPILMRAFIGLFFSYMITEILIGRQLPLESQENSLNYLVDIYLHGVMRQAL